METEEAGIAVAAVPSANALLEDEFEEQMQQFQADVAPEPILDPDRQNRMEEQDVDKLEKSKGLESLLEEAENSTTIKAALEAFKRLLVMQVELSIQESTERSSPCFGDSRVRKRMLFVLPDEAVRKLFIFTVSKERFLSRAVHLFGAPPYHFLRREDCGLLNTGAFSSSRTRMTYEDAIVCNYSQFGDAHFYDEFRRQYKVLYPLDAIYDEGAPLPQLTQDWTVGDDLDLALRIPKRKKGTAAIPFPSVGTTLTFYYLTKSSTGRGGVGTETRASQYVSVAEVRLRCVRQRDASARTALVKAALLSKRDVSRT